YLLQKEIVDAPEHIDSCFRTIYEPLALEPGRDWPPRVPRVIGFQRSEYPTFSNVLIHVNGAEVRPIHVNGSEVSEASNGAGHLIFNEEARTLDFSVIDGQHRINGAYLAVHILKTESCSSDAVWEIPAEVFL